MNYHSNEWIMKGLQYHYEEALKVYPKEQIFAIVLRGSQNYGLDTENSDIDSRCIYIPNKDQLYGTTSEEELVLPNGEQITFIDIRLFNHGLKIRSLYYLELLYSKWYIIPNEQYQNFWEQYRALPNDLVSSNKPAAAKSLWFYTDKKKDFLFDNFFPEHFEECVKRGYSNKAFYHIVRYHLLFQLLDSNEPFEKCMSEELNQQALFAKNGTMPAPEVHWLMVSLLPAVENLWHKIEISYPMQVEQCKKVEGILDTLQAQLMQEVK